MASFVAEATARRRVLNARSVPTQGMSPCSGPRLRSGAAAEPRLSAAIAAGLVLLAACAGKNADRAAAMAALAVDSVPFVEIASTAPDGTPRFGFAEGAVRLGDGRIVVLDGAGDHLVTFDTGGQLVRTVGRKGLGPGEFQFPTRLERCAGDSLLVWDGSTRRLIIFDSAGAVAREPKFSFTAAAPWCGPTPRMLVLAAPEKIDFPQPSGPPPAPTYTHGVISGPNGDSLAGFGPVELYVMRPLGATVTVTPLDTRFLLGAGDSGYADIYDLNGAKVGTRRVAPVPAKATRQDYERAVDRLVYRLPPGPARETPRQQFMTIPMPDRMPAYQKLLADPTGAVWAVVSGPGAPKTRIYVTSDSGAVLADFSLPDMFVPYDVGTDYILGIAETLDGEQHVREYRVRRDQAGAPRASRR